MNEKPDRDYAAEFRKLADHPAAGGLVTLDPTTLRGAADTIDRLQALACERIPELKDAIPLVLYFPTRADADAFISVAKQALPNVKSRRL